VNTPRRLARTHAAAVPAPVAAARATAVTVREARGEAWEPVLSRQEFTARAYGECRRTVAQPRDQALPGNVGAVTCCLSNGELPDLVDTQLSGAFNGGRAAGRPAFGAAAPLEGATDSGPYVPCAGEARALLTTGAVSEGAVEGPLRLRGETHLREGYCRLLVDDDGPKAERKPDTELVERDVYDAPEDRRALFEGDDPDRVRRVGGVARRRHADDGVWRIHI
jgi:hypothetical protein